MRSTKGQNARKILNINTEGKTGAFIDLKSRHL